MNLFKRIFFAYTLAFFAFFGTAQSATLNQLQTPELDEKLFSQMLLTNSGHLIFHSQSANQQITTYSLDLESFETVQLLSLDASTFRPLPFVHSMFELSTGQIIYNTKVETSNDGDKTQLYISNGTEPFVPLTGLLDGYNQFSSVLDGVYYHRSDTQLLVTDGLTTVSYNANGVVFPSCFFDVNHFVVTQYGGDSNDTMFLYKDGEVTPIFNEISISRVDQTTKNSTSCLFKVDVGINEFQHLYLNIDGQTRTVNRNDDWIVAMGEHYLAKTKRDGVFTLPKLSKLNQDLTEVAFIGLNDSDYFSVKIKPDGNGFWLTSVNSNDTSLVFFDQNLNINFDSSRTTNSSDTGLFIAAENDFYIAQSSLAVLNEGNHQGTLTFNPAISPQFIQSQNKEHAVFIADDMYLIEDQPRINDLMNGPWFDTAYQDQGISINPGVRKEGSQYLFLTYYLFNNNEPLWLAGVSNYIPGQKNITIELFEFQGADYLDYTTTPSSNTVGSMTLTPQSCHTMTGEFEYNGQLTSLNFNRINDSSFNSRCF